MDSIFSYISKNFEAENTAIKIISKIREKFDTIASNPFAYSIIDNICTIGKSYRRAVVENYIIYYQINTAISRVEVLRVLYNKRNFQNLI